MEESISGDIQQILTTFDIIITIYEDDYWVKTVCRDGIKIAFKMGNFIESTIATLKNRNTLTNFMKLLNNYRKFKLDKTQIYPEEFYSKICDFVLSKFFKCTTLNENVIDIAVRVYTSLFNKDRFQQVLQKLIIESASHQAITEFAVINQNRIDKNELKSKLLLNHWTLLWQRGQSDKIKSVIQESVISSQIDNRLGDLIRILSLESEHCSIKELILVTLTEKMRDRSILSRDFWLVLFRKVETQTISQASLKNPKFLESLMKFILYIGGMMEFDDNGWCGNPSTSSCPEISHDELKNLLKSLNHHDSIKPIIMDHLKSANSQIWDEMMVYL